MAGSARAKARRYGEAPPEIPLWQEQAGLGPVFQGLVRLHAPWGGHRGATERLEQGRDVPLIWPPDL